MDTSGLLALLKRVMFEKFNLPAFHTSTGNYTYAAIFTDLKKAKTFARVINEKTPYEAAIDKERHHSALYVDQPIYVVGIRENGKTRK